MPIPPGSGGPCDLPFGAPTSQTVYLGLSWMGADWILDTTSINCELQQVLGTTFASCKCEKLKYHMRCENNVSKLTMAKYNQLQCKKTTYQQREI